MSAEKTTELIRKLMSKVELDEEIKTLYREADYELQVLEIREKQWLEDTVKKLEVARQQKQSAEALRFKLIEIENSLLKIELNELKNAESWRKSPEGMGR